MAKTQNRFKVAIDKDCPFTKAWLEKEAWQFFLSHTGKRYRDLPTRRTIAFEYAGKTYFVKLHFDIGWREIFKNLLSVRLPITNAKTEWKILQYLEKENIPAAKVIACGISGKNPATQKSFLIMEALEDYESLEVVTQTWQKNKPDFQQKRKLISAIAELAKQLHDAGINHRDFYLCHFFINQDIWEKTGEAQLALIDLHRAQKRSTVPWRWRRKDLSGLLFSVLDLNLTRKDYLYFIKHYCGKNLKAALKTYNWQQIYQYAQKLYRQEFGRNHVAN